jgi:hypothetical protein
MQFFELVGLRTYCEDGYIYSYGDILQPERTYKNYTDNEPQAEENQKDQSDG